MEGKKIGQIQGKIRGEYLFSIPRYKKMPSTCIPNISILACMVVETSLKKTFFKVWKERNWTNTGKNNQKKAGSQSHNTTTRHQPLYQI